MPKSLPWMPWYADDWLRDEQLSFCSPATRGIWADALSMMHKLDRRGELHGDLNALARVCRCSPSEMIAALHELRQHRAADVTENQDGTWTLINRRMHREAQERDAVTARVRKHRAEKRNATAETVEGAPNNQPQQELATTSTETDGCCNSAVTLQKLRVKEVKSSSSLTSGDLRAFARTKINCDDDDDFLKLQEIASDATPQVLHAMATLTARGTKIGDLTRYARTLLKRGIEPDLLAPEHSPETWLQAKARAEQSAAQRTRQAEQDAQAETERRRQRNEAYAGAMAARCKLEAEPTAASRRSEDVLELAKAFASRPAIERRAAWVQVQRQCPPEQRERIAELAGADPVPWQGDDARWAAEAEVQARLLDLKHKRVKA